VPAGVTAAAVAEAGHMPSNDLVRSQRVSVRAAAAAARVIHVPAVVCTNSPNMTPATAAVTATRRLPGLASRE
jgi:hypothetical protein